MTIGVHLPDENDQIQLLQLLDMKQKSSNCIWNCFVKSEPHGMLLQDVMNVWMSHFGERSPKLFNQEN